MDKNQIRNHFKNIRKDISADEVEKKSQLIFQNFYQNLWLKKFINFDKKIFSAYYPINNEVNPDNIIKYLRSQNIKICFPKIIGKSAILDFIEAQDDNFTNSKFYQKILEPKSGKKLIADVIIVPLLSFDDELNRLGMGAGFYDRTLQYLSSINSIITIGLAFDIQRFEGILPIEEHDYPLDFIITESKILTCSHIL